jgi:quercetin dioxygenase-like cupin family protein
MIRAYLLYTGDDGHSHVKTGSISNDAMVQAEYTQFKETDPHSSWDWHADPVPRYVITITGILKFETLTGETFILQPGEVLIATDNTGTGHKWNMINEEPWKRVYVVFKEGANLHFVPDVE